MSELNALSWVAFYSEFATKLIKYKDDRKELIDKILNVYKVIGMKVPKLELDDNIVDIDPFTIFGLFNKGITNENRIKILKGISEEFTIESLVPDCFDGIPVLNNQASTFYYFIDSRGQDDIDNLWSIFEAALATADNETEENRNKFITSFDKAVKQKGVKWNITMGLYWVRPNNYINLDSRNRDFLCDFNNMPSSLIEKVDGFKVMVSGKEYLDICKDVISAINNEGYEYRSFPELSFHAWNATEKAKDEKRAVSKASFLKWFKPLLSALKEFGGEATPKQAKDRIIENENLSDEVINEKRGKTNVNKFDNEVAFARNYLVYGGYIDNKIRGLWKLTDLGMKVDMTDELASEIFTNGMKMNKDARSNVDEILADENIETLHYWIYSPGDGACKWDEFYNDGIIAIGWGEIGDLRTFTTKEEIKLKMKDCFGDELSYKNAAHATWQFANEMKPGDIVFAKKGMHQIIGRGIVTSDYEFDEERDDEYNNIREIKWTHHGQWKHPGQAVMKTLTDITVYTDYVEKLNSLFDEFMEEDAEEEEKKYPEYRVEEFLEEVYISEDNYKVITALLRNKKNLILQGAPGVGKTFAAKRLAYSVMGVKDPNRVMMIQFHQSYSYEDFIMGFRPSSSGFELKKGPFYNFCKKAEIDSENDYFFIIDEINRGNLSKIFGELFMLIENDKRGISLQLIYSDEKFSVPENVYIIGLMNTADRSLAMLDYALRRRFAFFEFPPAFTTRGFTNYRMKKKNNKFDSLIAAVEQLNVAIENDESLGKGFKIGHSYFCTENEIDDSWLNAVISYELIPLLSEYWFDEVNKVRDWERILRGAIQ